MKESSRETEGRRRIESSSRARGNLVTHITIILFIIIVNFVKNFPNF